MRTFLASLIPLSLACTVEEPPSPAAALYPECGRAALYQVTKISFGTGLEEVEGQSLDIDGDGIPDNVLGRLRSSIEALLGETSNWPQRAIDEGEIDWLIEIEECPDDDEGTYWRLASHRGSATGVGNGGLPAIAVGDKRARDGEALVPLSAFAELPGSPVGRVTWARGLGFGADFGVDDDRLVADIAAGFSPADVRTVVLPPLASGMTRVVAETDGCPSACPEGSYADGVMWLFDTNKDGVIEVEELEASSLIDSLSRPDLDLQSSFEGRAYYWPRHDLAADHISLGLSIVAERRVP